MSRRFLAVFLIAFCLLLGALAARNATLALMSIPFLAYLGVGLYLAPRPETLRLGAERSVQVAREADTAAVRVRVAVHSLGAGVPALRLVEAPLPGMTLVEGSLEQGDVLAAGGHARIEYTFHTERGVYRWETLAATAADPFRLFERRVDVPAPGEIVVRPRLRRFRPFALNPDRTLHSPGSIPAHRAGSGTDFWGLRDYRPGDQMRHLDWRRAARHPGQLFTREFEQEEIADLGIILDARQQSDLWSGGGRLFDFAREAAGSLAEMVLRGGNRSGMVLVEASMRVVYPGYGKVQLNRILRALAAARPDAEASRLSLDQVPLRAFSGRAMIVIISPLTVAEWQIFPRLRARGNEGVLISPDPVDFAAAGAVDDMGRLAVRLARLERRLALRRISQAGIRVVDWPVRTPLSPLLRRALQPARGGLA